MKIFWSLIFAVINLGAFGLFLAAPFMGWWLPKNVSSFGGDVDRLFYIILAVTGFFFVLTQGVLVYSMIRFGDRKVEKASYIHGHLGMEALWTAVPCLILIYLGFVQVPAWAKMKYIDLETWFPVRFSGKNIEHDLDMVVLARQWEWRIRTPQGSRTENPAQWAETGNLNDLHQINEIHAWKDAKVRIHLKTQDVIHSLFLPNLRLKQDALPGKTMPVWFQAVEANVKYNPATGQLEELFPNSTWEIACTELCGGSHYRMRGKLYIHESRQDYERWFADAMKLQRSHELNKQANVAASTGGRQ